MKWTIKGFVRLSVWFFVWITQMVSRWLVSLMKGRGSPTQLKIGLLVTSVLIWADFMTSWGRSNRLANVSYSGVLYGPIPRVAVSVCRPTSSISDCLFEAFLLEYVSQSSWIGNTGTSLDVTWMSVLWYYTDRDMVVNGCLCWHWITDRDMVVCGVGLQIDWNQLQSTK